MSESSSSLSDRRRPHPPRDRRSSWQTFWAQGGFWKALLLAFLYWTLYTLLAQLIGLVFGDFIDADNPLGDAASSFFAVIAPIVVGAVVLVWFVRSVGWWDELFGPQPIRGSWWMWILPLTVVATNLLRYVAVDYSTWSPANIVVILLAGLFVGFAEELLTRGLAVNMLRRAGHGEWAVATLSSLIFALLHVGNIVGGQDVMTVGIIVVYAFFFGVAMYLTLRVTGNLIWPILLHAMTDPSAFLLTGGIDVVDETAGDPGALVDFAIQANIIVIGFGLVFLLLIRGRVGTDEQPAGIMQPT